MRKLGSALAAVSMLILPPASVLAAGFGVPGGAAALVSPSGPRAAPVAPPRTLLATGPWVPAVVLRPPAHLIHPVAFVPRHFVHRHAGRVVVFVNPATLAIWPSGYWCWRGAQWWWVPQALTWADD